MAKKTAFTLLALFFAFSLAALEPEFAAPGSLHLRADMTEEGRYIISIHFEQDFYQAPELKAIKVTYEPSGTVPILIYAKDVTKEEKALFLKGKMAFGLMEVESFERLDPRVYLGDTFSIGEDDVITVEYLIDDGGEVSSVLGADVKFQDLVAADFSVEPVKKALR